MVIKTIVNTRVIIITAITFKITLPVLITIRTTRAITTALVKAANVSEETITMVRELGRTMTLTTGGNSRFF
jgi:hypothetical protein